LEFRIDSVLEATPARLWDIFFDVRRVAALIPGCEDVKEVQPLKEYSATMKQKIGPFRFEVPTRIELEHQVPREQVRLRATGRDRFTGTMLDVKLEVALQAVQRPAPAAAACSLALHADMQVNGKLASLGFGVVKKKSEELFAEFERRLQKELQQVQQPAPGRGGAELPAVDVSRQV
jgi:carbon monoxide dehydrogenase subunit G